MLQKTLPLSCLMVYDWSMPKSLLEMMRLADAEGAIMKNRAYTNVKRQVESIDLAKQQVCSIVAT